MVLNTTSFLLFHSFVVLLLLLVSDALSILYGDSDTQSLIGVKCKVSLFLILIGETGVHLSHGHKIQI